MKLRNSLNGQTTSLPEGPLSIYACGITPYSDAHIGHARTYVIFDLLQRTLQAQGRSVRLVRNITDIDDKIIKAASEHQVPWHEWADLYAEKNRTLMRQTGIQIPEEPKATDYIPETVWLIQQLLDKGTRLRSQGSVHLLRRLQIHRRPKPDASSRRCAQVRTRTVPRGYLHQA